jgi:hypothetical protein
MRGLSPGAGCDGRSSLVRGARLHLLGVPAGGLDQVAPSSRRPPTDPGGASNPSSGARYARNPRRHLLWPGIESGSRWTGGRTLMPSPTTPWPCCGRMGTPRRPSDTRRSGTGRSNSSSNSVKPSLTWPSAPAPVDAIGPCGGSPAPDVIHRRPQSRVPCQRTGPASGRAF